MAERNYGLQDAVDTVTEMTVKRVADYLRLKAALPSFGAAVDAEVARYLKGLEYFAQGANVWHYHSPRTCADQLKLLLVPVGRYCGWHAVANCSSSAIGYFADAPSAALGVPEAVLPVHQRVSVPATQPVASRA